MTPPLRVGVIGCGNICPVYLRNAPRFGTWRTDALADADPARARELASLHNISCVAPATDLLHDPALDAILNLTPPEAHGSLGLQVVRARKHLYTEKPLACSLTDARAIIDEASRQGVRVGSAPDTFLGAGLSTCREVIDRGLIGTPLAASAFMAYGGPEAWHPDPEFFYRPGAGPLLDMGPYYLTAAVHLMGPMKRVSAFAQTSHAQRTVASGPKAGTRFAVGTPTHIAGQVEFERGGILTLIMSFEARFHSLPMMEIYGSEGTLKLPDPNAFGGPVELRRPVDESFRPVEVVGPWADNSRGLGLHDMALAMRENRAHQASGELAYHVLEAMLGMLESATTGRSVALQSRASTAGPRPPGPSNAR